MSERHEIEKNEVKASRSAEIKERVTVPLSTEVKESLKTIAGAQGRTLTSTLEYALKVYIALHNQNGEMRCSVDNILLGEEISFGTAREVKNQFEQFLGYVKELREPMMHVDDKHYVSPPTTTVSSIGTSNVSNDVSGHVQDMVEDAPVEIKLSF